MGVYIKGMEMPQNCKSCNFYNGLGCKATGRMFAMFYNVATRRNDCPLTEVPEPHGRLIDADALCASHKEVCSRSMKFNLDLAQTVIPASEEAE